MNTFNYDSRKKIVLLLFVMLISPFALRAANSWMNPVWQTQESFGVSELVTGTMAPMTVMAKNENGYFYFAIRTYLGAPLPNPIKVTFTIYGPNNIAYYSGTAIMHETLEYRDLGYNMFSGTSGQWIRLDLINGAVVPYYSVERVSARLLLMGPNAGDYTLYFYNALFSWDSSVEDVLEASGLKDPSRTLETFRSVTLPTSSDF